MLSPILANIYLHEVLDEWFTRQVVARLRGQVRWVLEKPERDFLAAALTAGA